MAMKEVAERIKHLAHAETSGSADADYLLRRKWASNGETLAATGTVRMPLLRAYKKCTVKAAGFISDTGQSSSATDYRTVKLRKQDGAAGTPVDLSTKGGASTAITADSHVAFAVPTNGDEVLAANDILEVEFTSTGTSGAALGYCTAFVDVELD